MQIVTSAQNKSEVDTWSTLPAIFLWELTTEHNVECWTANKGVKEFLIMLVLLLVLCVRDIWSLFSVEWISCWSPDTNSVNYVCMLYVKHRLSLACCCDWILTAVPQSDWKRLAGRPHTSWLATMKNNLSFHNLIVEDATELTLDRPHWMGSKRSYALKWCKPNNDDNDVIDVYSPDAP